ncbi:MAG: TfoX/Sxy family protein [Flavobacteriales bacterium]|nr:TfoX/Sxy family protein [Flavobacteriales bacterium]
MAVDKDYQAYIETQLESFGDFEVKRMFGGIGYFRDKAMFGAIMHGAFRLKGDETSAPDFAKFGKGPHQVPGKNMTMPYYEVPEEILKDKAVLREWAFKAWEIALASKKK